MNDLFPKVRVDPTADIDRRYTTRDTMALCMRLAGVDAWDLDVAADEESHWAPNWYDVERDGLTQPWTGRVWCNPPFSDIAPWVAKAWLERGSNVVKTIAMLLPCNRTEQPWWQKDVEPYREGNLLRSHFLPGRVKFGHPGNRDGIGVGSPPFGCVLLVWGRR